VTAFQRKPVFSLHRNQTTTLAVLLPCFSQSFGQFDKFDKFDRAMSSRRHDENTFSIIRKPLKTSTKTSINENDQKRTASSGKTALSKTTMESSFKATFLAADSVTLASHLKS